MTTTKTAGVGHNQPPPLEAILADKHAPITKKMKAWLKKASGANLQPKTLEDVAALQQVYAEGDAIMKEAEKERAKEKEPYLRDGKIVDSFFNVGIRDAIDRLAAPIRRAALDRQLAITRENQRKADEEAKRLHQKAKEDEEKARAAEARGDIKQADIHLARADNKLDAADQAAGLANQDTRAASKMVVGGVSSSVGAKLVCNAIIRRDLDLEALRPFLAESELIKAVNALLKTGEKTLKGAVIVEEAVGSIRARR